jgi:glycosyltransferase involved in cell wall biosynthesis
LRRV